MQNFRYSISYLLGFIAMIVLFSGSLFSQTRYDPFPDGNTDYVWSGYKYDHTHITYYFENTTNDLSVAAQKQAIRDALTLWCSVTLLTFTEVFSPGEADITIKWGVWDHGDPCAPCNQPDNCCFDGPNGILAHSFYPQYTPYTGIVGDVHFDDDEDWTDQIRNNSNQPIDLVTVAAHEFGHSLGLGHSDNVNALMYAYYDGSHRYLHQDDIDGIHSVYGALYYGQHLSLSEPNITGARYYLATQLIDNPSYIFGNYDINISGDITLNAPVIVIAPYVSYPGIRHGVTIDPKFKAYYNPAASVCNIPLDDQLNNDRSSGKENSANEKTNAQNELKPDITAPLPEEFSLYQNYPNPFNPSTLIKYNLKENINVKIIIYDILGRIVKTLVNDFQNAGYKSVIWDGTKDNGLSVSSGIYIYKIEAGSFVDSKKMLMIK